MTELKVQTVEETPYLYVERQSSKADIAAAMGGAFGEVWGFMEQHGVAPAGGALSVYYDYSPGVMKFRAGFIISHADMGAAQGSVLADVTPAGQVLYFVHRGPYSGLEEAYGKMFSYTKEHGLSFIAPTWEIYLNDPSTVPEEQLLTECFQALS